MLNTLPWKWDSTERQNLIKSFGIKDYVWSKEQNTDLLNRMKWLSKEDLKNRMKTWINKWTWWNIFPMTIKNTPTKFSTSWWNTLPWKWNSIERQNLVNSFGIKNYTWTRDQNIDLLNKMKWLGTEDLKNRMKTWITWTEANSVTNEIDTSLWWGRDPQSNIDSNFEKPKLVTIDDISDEDVSKNIYKEKLEEMEKEREESINKENEESKRIAEEATKKEQEETIKQQEETRKAIQEQEAELERIKNSTIASDIARRRELEDNLARSKNIASRSANIAWAVAWQSWVLLPAWEIASITRDVLWSFDENISKAEQALISNKNELDKTLRASNIEILQKQENIDKWNELLSTKEWAPMLRYIQAAAEWDKGALSKVEEFHRRFIEEQSKFVSERAGIVERNKEQETQWKAFTNKERISDLLWALWDVPWIDKVNQSISWILEQYPNDSRADLIAKLKNLAADAVDETTNISTILQTDPTKWTNEMRNTIKRKLSWFEEVSKITSPDKEEEAIRDTANIEEDEATIKARKQALVDKLNKKILEDSEKRKKEARDKLEQETRDKLKQKSENAKQWKYNDAIKTFKEKVKLKLDTIKKYKESNPEKFKEEYEKLKSIINKAKPILRKYKSTT